MNAIRFGGREEIFNLNLLAATGTRKGQHASHRSQSVEFSPRARNPSLGLAGEQEVTPVGHGGQTARSRAISKTGAKQGRAVARPLKPIVECIPAVHPSLGSRPVTRRA